MIPLLQLDLYCTSLVPLSPQLAAGVDAIMVKSVSVGGDVTNCFHICHLDGSVEDFSYRKCLTSLFPGGLRLKIYIIILVVRWL
jgi:hypothetical protein